ncbi:hypothetical protein BOX15_Mlig008112g1 [Macrostomum lignano]|uniref:Ras-related protein Rab-39B n=1 Tax=Macrostomum lignano TaxID=282301 RepID=A0A267FNA1_9PLAT|nr:hypothetical protein BOX15_Mlig008112g1 [Macrostomum lignano]
MLPGPLFDYQFRVIIIGDTMVGKSSLVRYFVEGSADTACEATVGVDFFARLVQLPDGSRIKLTLWDTAGHEKFRSITRSYYRNAVAALIVFDVTNRDSFSSVSAWLKEARLNMTCPDPGLLLVGQKADMSGQRTVSLDEASGLAEQLGLAYIETSAISGHNVEACFRSLAERVYCLLMAGRYTGMSPAWDGVRVGRGVNSSASAAAVRLTANGTGETEGGSGCCS